MPPTPSKVSDQFIPTDSTGRSSMVLCTHCRTTKIPRNSLQRKEEHLRGCTAFTLSPLSTALDSNGQNLLAASISARSTRTKPGNLKINQGRERGSYVGRPVQRIPIAPPSMALQERVERIIRGENGAAGRASSESLFTPHASNSTYTYNDTPASENISALSESAARKRPREQSLEGTPSATPGADDTASATQMGPQSGTKKFKNAELYLDEDDYGFLCSAQTVREMKFAAVVERLARLIRLRDTR